MKKTFHCQDNYSWWEGDGQSSSVLAGLDCWSWNSGWCDVTLIWDNTILPVPSHDGLLVDMVNESIEEDYNITCDKISNKHVTRMRIQVTRIRIQYVTRIRIQHVTRIRIQHVTKIQIQHVMRIRVLHVNKIYLIQRRTTENDDGGSEVDIIISWPRMSVCRRRWKTHLKFWRFF